MTTAPAPLRPRVPSQDRPEPTRDLKDIQDLLAIMARLRASPGGCPWDIAQTFATIVPYTIEEAYEVADAIARQDIPALKDELGDLLFQVVFHARMAEEAGRFGFADVIEAICTKMIRRHPHVFGNAAIPDAAAQTVAWENLKAQERASARARAEAAGEAPAPASVLDGLPEGLPALKQAEKFQRRAARVGFDWTDAKDVIGKIREELEEVTEEVEAAGANAALGADANPRLADEIGDLLFAVVNLARKADIDPGMALRGTNQKFSRRFRRVEALLAAAGRTPAEATLAEMEALWVQAKHEERGS
ncbi:nucleoside triphosphate pyrophosphohydrolase [Aestuariivirga sp.]|uniref:nucleoside triphosphate pyrophosphohydrolase n=1 Tax=Aestuariivirga sp. TaxID=2650926 RepID=UPI0035B41C47